jgi:hypothetical protein
VAQKFGWKARPRLKRPAETIASHRLASSNIGQSGDRTLRIAAAAPPRKIPIPPLALGAPGPRSSGHAIAFHRSSEGQFGRCHRYCSRARRIAAQTSTISETFSPAPPRLAAFHGRERNLRIGVDRIFANGHAETPKRVLSDARPVQPGTALVKAAQQAFAPRHDATMSASGQTKTAHGAPTRTA